MVRIIIYGRTKLGLFIILIIQPRKKYVFHNKQRRKTLLRFNGPEFCFQLLILKLYYSKTILRDKEVLIINYRTQTK